MSAARRIAATVLRRVWEDDAFAAAALSAELDRAGGLDPRDRALATELVYGVLRTEGYLLEVLGRFGKIRRADTELTSHLLVGAYQIAFLDRVPQRAAVHEAVAEIKRARGARVAGFANAVLRKVTATELEPLPVALRRSAPRWLVERMARAVGDDETAALLGGDGAGVGVGLRLAGGAAAPAWLSDPDLARPSALAPGAYRFRGGGDPRRLPGYAEGAFVVQEEGAQLVTWAVGARPGERVLDACAGRGQKASLLAELVGPTGELWATDLHPGKLEQLRLEFERLGLPRPRTVAVDWTRGAAPAVPCALEASEGAPGESADGIQASGDALPGGFDRVVVDVPCVGDGTLRRRPEIARRLRPEDPARLTDVQRAILRAAATQARPGGRVIYATCSVLREACEEVLEGVGELLEPVPFDAPRVAEVFPPDRSSLRLLPGTHGTDGYFVASLRRR
ncbi:MAG: Sun protein [Myxococcales bacterium]|jgi:16S rRNA (cytosine967-C5)-methyltransferase|nr:Sun protein [Myxococcales bacterium]